MLRIVIKLPGNRDKPGTIHLENGRGEVVAGPFPALGRAADNVATAHGNPHRIRTRQFGDTPLGTWRVTGWLPNGDARHPESSYGMHGRIMMVPQSGEALVAQREGHRTGIWIHAGDETFERRRGLKGTAGCVRIVNEHMNQLVNAIASCVLVDGRPSSCEIVEEDVLVETVPVDLEAPGDLDPPGPDANSWDGLPGPVLAQRSPDDFQRPMTPAEILQQITGEAAQKPQVGRRDPFPRPEPHPHPTPSAPRPSPRPQPHPSPRPSDPRPHPQPNPHPGPPEPRPTPAPRPEPKPEPTPRPEPKPAPKPEPPLDPLPPHPPAREFGGQVEDPHRPTGLDDLTRDRRGGGESGGGRNV